jgi:hypothetical protein
MRPVVNRFALVSLVVAGAVAIAVPVGAGTTTDQQIAEAGAIADTDITTSGWFKGTQDDTRAETRTVAKKTKGCKDYVAVSKSFDTTTEAASPEYSASSQELSNYSYVYTAEAAAKKAFARASAAGVADCLSALFTKQFEAQLKENPQLKQQVDDYRAAIADVPAVEDAVGDEAVGYGGGIEITGTDGSVQRVQVSTLMVRVGRAILTYTYQFAPNSGNNTLLDQVISNTVARSQAAQA